MTRILALLAAAGVLAFGATTAARAADAKTNWNKHCAACHGKNGAGKAEMKTLDYTKAGVQARLTDEEILKAIKNGVPRSKMKKGYANQLSEQEIKDQLALIRSFKK